MLAAALAGCTRGASPVPAAPASARGPVPPPAAAEQRMREWIAANRESQVEFLARVVNIPSGTMNHAGVRRTGREFQRELDALGFATRWIEMPDSVNRAGHLFAEHRGAPGRATLLLIGHLDTVFEGPGQQWSREDSTGHGAGSSDMKGGDVVILWALKAMAAAGVLDSANIIVALTGDEESAGEPLSVSRGDLIAAARRSDAALAFEGGSRGTAVVARRGSSSWLLTVTGTQAHSSGVFSRGVGYGAIYEAARILDGFRQRLAGRPNITFNPGVIVGGTDVTFDTARLEGRAAGKENIVASRVVVPGDLRFLSNAELEQARAVMREVVSQHLPGTRAEIRFFDSYPAMSPTAGNYALLAAYDSVSRALGHGPVEAFDPGRRGAGDVSFVAPVVDALDGLGAPGGGAHSPNERVSLPALTMQTERAALLIHRLSKRPTRRAITP